MTRGLALSVKAFVFRPSFRKSDPPLSSPTHRHTQKMVLESGPVLESRVAEKAACYPSDYCAEKTPPIVLFCSDNRPVVGRQTQTKTTLSVSSCSPYSLYPSFGFLCDPPTGISNPEIPELLSLSLLPSIPPSSATHLPFLLIHIILRLIWLIRETLYGGSIPMRSKRTSLVQSLGVKSHDFVEMPGKKCPLIVWAVV